MELSKIYITRGRLDECIQAVIDSMEEGRAQKVIVVPCRLENGYEGWMVSDLDPENYEYLGDWLDHLGVEGIQYEINTTRNIEDEIKNSNGRMTLECIILGA